MDQAATRGTDTIAAGTRRPAQILSEWRAAERALALAVDPADRERLAADVERLRDEYHGRLAPEAAPQPAAVPDEQATIPIYSIGAVARMLDVPVATLRTWEDRYELIQPTRSPGGQRLYSRTEIERLRFIRARLDEGLSPADAHRLLEERLDSARADGTGADPARHRLLILLAERDRYAAEIAEYFLRTEGYDVVVSFEASDAEETTEARSPDITILDWLISGGIGAQTCRRLKARHEAPVIVVSSFSVADVALEAGADAFLRKPLDSLRLVSTVKDLLGESAVTRRAVPAR